MSKVLVLGTIAAGAAWGQCTLWNQGVAGAGCAGVYTLNGGMLPSGAPSLASFLAGARSDFQAIRASVANLPQPRINIAAQNWPCAGEVLSMAVPMLGPECKPYAILLAGAGVTTQDYFVWQAAMAASVEYQALGVTGQYNIATNSSTANMADCQTNTGAPYLPYGTLPGTGSGVHCWALYYYDLTFSYLHNNGLTARTGTSTMTDFVLACGLTPGSISEAQYESCVLPLQKAEVTRWARANGSNPNPSVNAVTAMQIFQEPTAGMSGEQCFSVADVSTFIQHASAALKGIASSGSAFKVGASGTGLSYPQNYDNAYWTDWTTNPGTGSYAALDFYVIDLFSGNCNPGTYATELAGWAGTGTFGYIKQAAATGKPVRVGQMDAPMWCPTTGHAGQNNAILGSDDVIWDTSGFFDNWLAAVLAWASAEGLDSVSIYGSLPLFYWSSNQSDDNPFTESALTPMANLAATDSAATYKMLGKWAAESLQGNAHLSGNARLGQ